MRLLEKNGLRVGPTINVCQDNFSTSSVKNNNKKSVSCSELLACVSNPEAKQV